MPWGLHGAFCFPSLSLYVTCCPNLEVTTPQLAGCPLEFQDTKCCTEDATATFLSLADVAPEHEDHKETMNLLWYFLRDIDLLSLDAWRLLVKGTAQAANFRMFEFKSGLKILDVSIGAAAIKLSRLMVKTMHRIEGFQQFCLWHIATATGRMVTEVAVESCEMSELLFQYKAAAANHDFLMYSLIPRVQLEVGSSLKEASPHPEHPTVALQVVCVGPWAQHALVTLQSLLRHRSSHARLRILVLSDAVGWEDWTEAWEALGYADGVDGQNNWGKAEKTEISLQGVSFERIDFAHLESFQRYMKRYPSNCNFQHGIELAMLARALCHELLPQDVDWVISMDVGDVLVLEDIVELWKLRPELEQHFLAVSYAWALGQHLNAGLVLYNLRRMRQGNFTELTLRAAVWEVERGDGICPRDQNILNMLHDEDFLGSLRSLGSLEDGKIMRILPCRWSLFPAVDWHPAWSKPDLWHPELFQRIRYPGLVSSTQVELYCPDPVDLLMAFAFLPISGSRQGRVRLYAEQEGGGHLRHCHPSRIGQPCCACGEAAALVHFAGDLKRWPAMQNFLGREDTEGRSRASEQWWGGDFRQQKLKKQSEEKMFLMAKDQGLELLVPVGSSWCRTLRTEAGARYRASGLGQLRGEEREVQTTAREFRVLISSSNRSLEISMEAQHVVLLELGAGGAGGAVLQHACFERRWISLRLGFGSQPQLELCGDKMALPAMLGGFSLQIASEQEAPWAICVT